MTHGSPPTGPCPHPCLLTDTSAAAHLPEGKVDGRQIYSNPITPSRRCRSCPPRLLSRPICELHCQYHQISSVYNKQPRIDSGACIEGICRFFLQATVCSSANLGLLTCCKALSNSPSVTGCTSFTLASRTPHPLHNPWHRIELHPTPTHPLEACHSLDSLSSWLGKFRCRYPLFQLSSFIRILGHF
jgi:hypothetical protein